MSAPRNAKLQYTHLFCKHYTTAFNPCGTFEVTALRSPSWVFWTPGVSTHNEAPVNAGDTPSSLSDLAGVLEVLDLPVACSELTLNRYCNYAYCIA